jgi:peptide deformylase
MVREILLLGNPVLRSSCARVKNFADPAVGETIADLRDTLGAFRSSHGFGRGIAAPQIGVTRRILFIHLEQEFALINPEIVKKSKKMMTLWDDCFSFPDILVKVRRHVGIAVAFRDKEGTRRTLEATGGLSELLQHEIDHLDGVLAIDRAVDSQHIVLRSEWNKMKEHAKGTVSM